MRNKLYTQFFAAWNTANIPMERAEFISIHAGGVSSLKELKPNEISKLVDILNEHNIKSKKNKMRRKIISEYRKKYPGALPEDAILWAERQGVKMPNGIVVRKKINKYNEYELTRLIDAAERMVKEENARIYKM